MKIVGVIAKILTALAAIAGAIYVLATYGEKIVEWAKGVWASMPKCECTEEEAVEETEEAIEEETVEEEPIAEAVEEIVEEVQEVVEEIVEDVVADDADFEG